MKKSNDTTNSYQVIIDSGAVMTIAGLWLFKKYYHEMPKAMRACLEPSERQFNFGGGETWKSLGTLVAPMYILDDDHQAHIMMVRLYLVNEDFSMLFRAISLENSEAIMKFGISP